MSSPRTAKKPSKMARAVKPGRKPVKTAAPKRAPSRTAKLPTSETTVQARKLAADIERGLSEGHAAQLSPEALQELMAALCKNYSAQVEAGNEILPLRGRTSVTSTDIMTTASGLLKAANLAVFELGMWQSWTGR
jgi:hypothetical protein